MSLTILILKKNDPYFLSFFDCQILKSPYHRKTPKGIYMEEKGQEPGNDYNTQVIKALKDQAEEVDNWLDKLKNMLFQAEAEPPKNDKKKKEKK